LQRFGPTLGLVFLRVYFAAGRRSGVARNFLDAPLRAWIVEYFSCSSFVDVS